MHNEQGETVVSEKSSIFFIPGEAYMFVRHKKYATDAILVRELQNTDSFKLLLSILQQDGSGAELAQETLMMFSPQNDQKLNRSTVKISFSKLGNTVEDNAKLLRLVLNANGAIQNALVSKRQSSDRVEHISKDVPLSESQPPATPEIVGVSPNWIIEASSDSYPNGGGGPGEHHVTAHLSTAQFNTLSKFNLPKQIPETATGQGVEVYILDSFPPDQQPLIVQPGVNAELNNRSIQDLCPHPYWVGSGKCEPDMPSHGLFAANIIRSIAPGATVWPVLVLNENAIGTMISLANGLLAVYQDREKRDQ